MSSVTTTRYWPSLDAFYDERGGRRSGELDFGVMWTDGRRSWPRYRVSCVKTTGDVYAIVLVGAAGDHDPRARVELLGSVGSDDAYARAERILAGWEYVSGCKVIPPGHTDEPDAFHPADLQWARNRFAAAGIMD